LTGSRTPPFVGGFHLDPQIDDPETAAGRAVGLGATRLADGPTWITLADPAGHPFDLCQTDGVGPVMELFAVTIDAPDASALARFCAEQRPAGVAGGARLAAGSALPGPGRRAGSCASGRPCRAAVREKGRCLWSNPG
jgi:Glyoxalase-like domain